MPTRPHCPRDCAKLAAGGSAGPGPRLVVGALVPGFGDLDGLWQLWDRLYQQCLHDKLARTVVVRFQGELEQRTVEHPVTVQPGWYADPAEPTTQRWWDGEGWAGDPLPIDATPPPGPPSGTGETGDSEVEPARPETPPPGTPPPGPPPEGAPPQGTPPQRTPPPGPPPPGPLSPGTPPPGPPPPGPPPPGPLSPGRPISPPPGWPPPGVQPPVTGPPLAAGPPPGWPHPPYGFPLPPGFPAPPPQPHGHPLAPFGPRLAARMIDIGVVLLLNVLVNGWFVWRYVQEVEPVFREILRRSLAGNSSTEGLPQISGQADGLQVVILLIAAALWFAYEVPSVANGGQTFGKRLMGVKVVPLAADEPLGFGRSLRRWNLLGLPTFLWCCGLGFLLQLVDCVFPLFDRPLRQALHDKRAQTVVVQAPASRPAADEAPSRPDDPDRHGGRPS